MNDQLPTTQLSESNLDFAGVVHFDRVRGGWHPDQQFSETIAVKAPNETVARVKVVRGFRLNKFPVARIINVTLTIGGAS